MVPFDVAFPHAHNRGMTIFNSFLGCAHFTIVVLLAFIFVPSEDLAEKWAGAGESIIAITAILLAGLIAAYRGVRSSLGNRPAGRWRQRPANSTEWTLMIAVVSLPFTVGILFLYRIVEPTNDPKSLESIVAESGLVAVAAAFACLNLLSMFGAFVAISVAWERSQTWIANEAPVAIRDVEPRDNEPDDADPALDRRPRIARDVAMAGIGALALIVIQGIRRSGPPR